MTTSKSLIFTETPMLMKGPLVLASLADLKTMTRRHITQRNALIDGDLASKKAWAELDWSKPDLIRADPGPSPAGNPGPYLHVPNVDGDRWHRVYPRVRPGTKIWIKETGWQRPFRTARDMREGADTWAPFYYDADGLSEGDHEQFKAWGFKRRPSIHMPRVACRLNLEATKVRVERLQSISAKDIMAEGVVARAHHDQHFGKMPVSALDSKAYVDLRSLWFSAWEGINGPGSWALNPWNGPGSWVLNPWVWVYEFRRIKS